MSHLQRSMMFVAADEFNFSDQFFGIGIIEEKGETLDGFVGEATAAGLFPRQMFVENGDVVASASELFAAHGARRTTPDNRYFSHCYIFLACRKSIGWESFGGFGEPSNMDNQQAETLEKYSTENPGSSHCDVCHDVCSSTWASMGYAASRVNRGRALKKRTFGTCYVDYILHIPRHKTHPQEN